MAGNERFVSVQGNTNTDKDLTSTGQSCFA